MKYLKLVWQFLVVLLALKITADNFFYGDGKFGWIVGILWIGVALINLNREMKKNIQSRG